MHAQAPHQIQALLQTQLAHLLTEPLTITALADYFEISREKMAKALERMEGIERIGKTFRIPLCKMPPKYLLEVGLVEPLRLSDFAGF